MKESAWKALDRVMALLWSGAGVRSEFSSPRGRIGSYSSAILQAVEGIGTALVHDSAAIESVEFAPIVDKRKAA
ncbi:unnamed protein product [Dovyalis caffra]|uniref:Uncharacterized protein n=1 Tax=Dovyalis caffra TaxID=77055 RepID=A0AAV1QNU7_9ROSI|nr:unnamed protein product [Dovyalis caffra]CAK7328722.1 unnamed protein product [Dovyalis caffra]CAK7328788.1 unnamed protein product [Dovyalis caffra]